MTSYSEAHIDKVFALINKVDRLASITVAETVLTEDQLLDQVRTRSNNKYFSLEGK